MADNRSFHVGQKAFIHRGSELLVLFWNRTEVDLPGGRIQHGEVDIEAALKREVREETGLEIEVGAPVATWLNSAGTTYLVGFDCTYVSGEVVLSEEHDGFRWVDAGNYADLDDGHPHFAALRQCFERMAASQGAVRQS